MANPRKMTKEDISELKSRAVDTQTGPDIYANHVQITGALHDFVLDFYMLSPGIGKEKNRIHMKQRVFIPTSLVKGLINALQEVVSTFEGEIGIELLDTRSKDFLVEKSVDPDA